MTIAADFVVFASPDEYFSVIHARMLMSSLLCGSSHTFLNELSRCLRPGGLLLLEEPEVSHSPLSLSVHLATYAD